VRRSRRRSARSWLIAFLAVALVLVGVGLAALVEWPHVRLDSSPTGLAQLRLQSFAGHVTAVAVRDSSGRTVPVRLAHGAIVPTGLLDAGQPLSVTVTVRRPGWSGWLVGRSEGRTFAVLTPQAPMPERWLEPKLGTAVRLRFDTPVSVVWLRGHPRQRLARPAAVFPLGVVAGGADSAGAVQVAAAARSWERLSRPVRVSWFAARSPAQLLAEPRPGSAIGPVHSLTLTFARPVGEALGGRLPTLRPASPGHWWRVDPHTLVFKPSGLGFGLGATVYVSLPRPAKLASDGRLTPRSVLRWRVRPGSTLRLQQLLAQAGYLPVVWHPVADPPASPSRELAWAVSPPQGRFSWRYRNTPRELKALWHPGSPNEVTQGAVMAFELDHDMATDGVAGPDVWRALLLNAVAGKRHTGGYSYVFVHRNLPQSLNLWHNGRVIVTSPGNTGIPAAPTQLGTWPVFEHIPVGTMSGTNPDGTKYNDPGIQYISYFHGGDAIHAFNRPSYGTPQSLGCVELPLSAAAQVYPYTPIGTLVTIEN
jgi:peptidoglycan hydrolase-like protein with peptidoglycan-binding domain